MKKLIFLTLALAAVSSASVFTLSTPSPVVNGTFTVDVNATHVFDGRDPLTDAIITYGFNVASSNPAAIVFLSAESGPDFDPPSSVGGTDVFAAAQGIFLAPPVADPLLLARLTFKTVGPGSSVISISSDPMNDFQGLWFLNEPVVEPISGELSLTVASAVPEPSTFAMLLAGAGLLALSRRKRR